MLVWGFLRVGLIAGVFRFIALAFFMGRVFFLGSLTQQELDAKQAKEIGRTMGTLAKTSAG